MSFLSSHSSFVPYEKDAKSKSQSLVDDDINRTKPHGVPGIGAFCSPCATEAEKVANFRLWRGYVV